MYFSSLPSIIYPFTINNVDQYIVLKDITVNARFIRDVVSNITLYDTYNIVDGETPEIIAERFYDNPEYHWVLMLVNERYDYINDFPLPYDRLAQYVTNKYGADNEYDIHHYENAAGWIVNSNAVGAVSVSNFGYEETINESKRAIKIINKTLVDQIVYEFIKAVA